MITFKLHVKYNTTITSDKASFAEEIEVTDVHMDKEDKYRFFNKIYKYRTPFNALSLDIICKIVLTVYNQLMSTKFTVESIDVDRGLNKNSRIRTKYDVTMARKLFCYVAKMEGYSVRKTLEYLGYKKSIIHYSKLLEDELNAGNETAVRLYTCVRRIINNLSTKVDMVE